MLIKKMWICIWERKEYCEKIIAHSYCRVSRTLSPQNLLLNRLSIILDYFHRSLFTVHLPVGIFPVLSSLTLLTTIRNKTGNILNYQTKSIHILTTD